MQLKCLNESHYTYCSMASCQQHLSLNISSFHLMSLFPFPTDWSAHESLILQQILA
jgi:uncharacterized membrane protein